MVSGVVGEDYIAGSLLHHTHGLDCSESVRGEVYPGVAGDDERAQILWKALL